MRDDHNRWEKYKGILAHRASDHPVQWVLLTVIFAFLAGLNTICVLFGSHFLRPFQIPVALGVYVVAASYLCVAIFGFALVACLRQNQNRTDESTSRERKS
jgi:hypothetical protein